METWAAFGTGSPPSRVTDELVRAVCRGEYPWQAGAAAANGGGAAQCHYGRRYRTCQAQLARTLEEEDILAAEVLRTFNWIEERTAGFEERHGALAAELRGAASLDGSVDRLLAGKKALLERELELLHAMGRAATAKWRSTAAPPP